MTQTRYSSVTDYVHVKGPLFLKPAQKLSHQLMALIAGPLLEF
jgi:hypothetical protein